MRGDVQLASPGDEAGRVVAAVGAYAQASAAGAAPLTGEQPQAGLTLAAAGGRSQLAVDDQAVAVLGEAVAGVAETRLLAASLLGQA